MPSLAPVYVAAFAALGLFMLLKADKQRNQDSEQHDHDSNSNNSSSNHERDNEQQRQWSNAPTAGFFGLPAAFYGCMHMIGFTYGGIAKGSAAAAAMSTTAKAAGGVKMFSSVWWGQATTGLGVASHAGTWLGLVIPVTTPVVLAYVGWHLGKARAHPPAPPHPHRD